MIKVIPDSAKRRSGIARRIAFLPMKVPALRFASAGMTMVVT
jgi:hypothetical protein